MTNPAFTQLTFRLRNDNGNETTATWRQTQGTDDTLSVNTNYRCRFRIDETASRAWSNKTWNLRFSHNGGAYVQAADGQAVKLVLSGNFAQGDDCTTQLTGGTGTFVTDNNGMCESAGALNSGAAGQLFEVEFCFQIDSSIAANNDTIALRIYDGTAALAAYTDSPLITVSNTTTTHQPTATLSGASSLTAVGGVTYKPTATLSGASSLVAAALLTQTHTPTATLTATSSLVVVALLNQTHLPVASLSGESSLTVVSTITYKPTSTLEGTSSLVATGLITYKPVASLSGESSLVVNGKITHSPVSTLSGTSSLVAAGVVTLTHTPVASLSGTSSLVAAGEYTGTHTPTAVLEGTSSLTASAVSTHTPVASLSGASSLITNGTNVYKPTGALEGTSSLTATADLNYTTTHYPVASLTGSSSLVAGSTVTFFPVASLVGQSSLEVSGVLIGMLVASLLGTSWMTAAFTPEIFAMMGVPVQPRPQGYVIHTIPPIVKVPKEPRGKKAKLKGYLGD